jgi:hypothetical protein
MNTGGGPCCSAGNRRDDDRQEEGAVIWVTRTRPKTDRIACPWLIRRFIDPQGLLERATFVYDALYACCCRDVAAPLG